MTRDPIMVLLQLGAVTLIAVGAVLVLLRLSSRAHARQGGVIRGYPAHLFPARNIIVQCGALTALAATQERLLTLYAQAPAQSDMAIWLAAFLRELRQIMDTAYHVAVAAQGYGQPPQLDRLVAEVQAIEAQIAQHAVDLLLARDGDAAQESLNGRLMVLRLCAREIARG